MTMETPGAKMDVLTLSPTKALRVPESRGAGVCYDLLKWWRLRALLVKNFIRMWRNLGFLVFQFLIPTVQVSKLHKLGFIICFYDRICTTLEALLSILPAVQ